MKAYRALGTFRADAPFRPWLLRIVANETRNLYRMASRRRAREHSAENPAQFAPIGEAADPAETAIDRERRQALWAALHTLPAPQRTVLTCRYLLDLDEAETAAVLGIARGTVKSRSNRGLRSLRASWPAERATEGGAAMAERPADIEALESELRGLGNVLLIPPPDGLVEAVMTRLEDEPIPVAAGWWNGLLDAASAAGRWLRERWRVGDGRSRWGNAGAAAGQPGRCRGPAMAGVRGSGRCAGTGAAVERGAPAVRAERDRRHPDVVGAGAGGGAVRGRRPRLARAADSGHGLRRCSGGDHDLVGRHDERSSWTRSAAPPIRTSSSGTTPTSSHRGARPRGVVADPATPDRGARARWREEVVASARQSGPVLLWQSSGVTLRLEGVSDQARAVAIAESVAP